MVAPLGVAADCGSFRLFVVLVRLLMSYQQRWKSLPSSILFLSTAAAALHSMDLSMPGKQAFWVYVRGL